MVQHRKSTFTKIAGGESRQKFPRNLWCVWSTNKIKSDLKLAIGILFKTFIFHSSFDFLFFSDIQWYWYKLNDTNFWILTPHYNCAKTHIEKLSEIFARAILKPEFVVVLAFQWGLNHVKLEMGFQQNRIRLNCKRTCFWFCCKFKIFFNKQRFISIVNFSNKWKQTKFHSKLYELRKSKC